MWGFVIPRISLYRGSFCRRSLNGGLRYIEVRYTEDFVISRGNESWLYKGSLYRGLCYIEVPLY